jgi:hypothetical protein
LYFGSFTKQVKPNFFWWEFMSLAKSIILVTAISMVQEDAEDSSAYFAILFILLGYLAIETFCSPYLNSNTAKRSAMWSFIAILLVIADAVVFKSNQASEATKFAWAMVMIILIILALCTVIKPLMQWYHKVEQKQIEEPLSAPNVVEIEDLNALRQFEGISKILKMEVAEVQKITVVRKTPESGAIGILNSQQMKVGK